MKVILGLGNPGREYDSTRHNLGFFVLDHLAVQHSTEFFPKNKYFAQVAECSSNNEKILLVKPQTFYNEAGQTARAIVDFYKLQPSTDLLVIHDELALPFGTIRVRNDGSDAGNNGIKSLNAHLGQQYTRLRIGINTPLRDQMDDADFVLARFNREEQKQLSDISLHAQKLAENFISGTLIPSSHTALSF